jgi:FlaA1/EpsC-like NDP-sugar epimerase
MHFGKKLIGLPRQQKQQVALVFDMCLSLLATWMAFSLRLDVQHVPQAYEWIPYGLSSVLFIPVFIKLGLYRAIFRYSGAWSLSSSATAVAIYGLLFFLILITMKFPGVPRSVGILQPILFFSMVFGSRVLASQLLKGANSRPDTTRNVMIYGAGEAGAQAAHALGMTRNFTVKGFLDDDPAKHGRRLNGLEIFSPAHAKHVVEKRGVSDILIAVPSAGLERRRQIVDSLVDLQVRVRSIPGILDLARGADIASDIQELQIIDLLERAPIASTADFEAMEGASILVTGAGGSIGSELCRQILERNPERLILVDHNEFGLYTIDSELQAIAATRQNSTRIHPCLCSVRDERRLETLFSEHRPEFVFHAAAYKHVPLVEANPVEAITNNVIGTLNVAQACVRTGVRRFTLISTDKAVRPTNIMGASKRLAELIVQALADEREIETIFSMVRFGNVLGSSGSVVPLFRRQIAAGGPVTITHPEVTRYFMTIPEAVGLVLHSSQMAEGGEVFVLDMGEPVRIIDLARKMIRLAGRLEKTSDNPDGDIEIVEVGLRPGEKLYEELLIGENPQPTANQHIMKAHERFLSWRELEHVLAELKTAVDAEDINRLIDVFQRTVLGFRHRPGNGKAQDCNDAASQAASRYSESGSNLSGLASL